METPGMTPDAMSTPKKSNTVLIVAVIVVLLLCCCCIFGIGCWYLYTNGDALMKSGTSLLLRHII